MREFFRSTRLKVLAAVLAVVIVASVAAAASHNGTSVLSSALGTVFGPVQRLSAFVSEKIGEIGGGFVSAGTYKKQVEELQKQVEEYQKQLVDYEKTLKENLNYEEFLDVKEEHNDFVFASARVISRDAADMFYSFVINKGTNDGVAVNDPVISGEYLVGVVVKTAPTYSVVKTVLDPQVSVGAYEIRTGESGFASGDTQLALQGLIKLSGIESETAIATGGIVSTSGIGGVYPRDLIIGTVTEIKDNTHDISSYAVIKPGVDVSKLDAVFVITDFEGQGITADGDNSEE